MRVVRLFVTVAAAILVGSCATTSPAERRAADDLRCRSYGFRPGTDAFAKCRLDIDLDRAAERRSRLTYPYDYGPRPWYWSRVW